MLTKLKILQTTTMKIGKRFILHRPQRSAVFMRPMTPLNTCKPKLNEISMKYLMRPNISTVNPFMTRPLRENMPRPLRQGHLKIWTEH